MADSVYALRDDIVQDAHHAYRNKPLVDDGTLALEYAAQGFSDMERAMRRFVWMLRRQEAKILPRQRIVGMCTNHGLPSIFTEEEIKKRGAQPTYERARNILPDYAALLRKGFGGRRAEAQAALGSRISEGKRAFLEGEIACLDAILAYCSKLAIYAEMDGDSTLAATLRAAETGANSLREALQILRIATLCLWLAGHGHAPLGRLDHYLLPYYSTDRQEGMTKSEATALLQEFFLTLRLEADIPAPAEHGGQAITLGGADSSGRGAFNELTLICLLAAADLDLPDIPICLRANAETPQSLFELAAQICTGGEVYIANDDCILPALKAQGYLPMSVHAYAFGAGGTLLIPGRGERCLGEVSLAGAAQAVVAQYLERSTSFTGMLSLFGMELRSRVDAILEQQLTLVEPAPIYALLLPGQLEEARAAAPIDGGGIFFSGLADAANLFCVIRAKAFETDSAGPAFLAQTLAKASTPDALQRMFPDVAQTGNNDMQADQMLQLIATAAQEALRGRKGPGGSALYALAPPGGHSALSGGLSGPTATIHSYTKIEHINMARNGPLLLQLYEGADAREAAQHAASFISMGGNELLLRL